MNSNVITFREILCLPGGLPTRDTKAGTQVLVLFRQAQHKFSG